MKELKLGKLSINKQVVSVLSDKQSASIKGGRGKTFSCVGCPPPIEGTW